MAVCQTKSRFSFFSPLRWGRAASVILVPYALLHAFNPPADGFDGRFLVVGAGLVLTAYSLVFFAKDLFAEFLNRYGGLVIGAVSLLLGLTTAIGVVLLLKSKAAGLPVREITVGSDEFRQLVDKLVSKQRQSCLALGNNLEVVVDGTRYRVR